YVEFGHRLKNRQQVWIVERFPIDVGIELDAAQPQAPDRVVDFAQRRRDIIERQAGNTGGEAVWILCDQRGELLIGDTGQLRTLPGRRHRLDRRQRQAQHLDVVVEPVQNAKARVQVDEGG